MWVKWALRDSSLYIIVKQDKEAKMEYTVDRTAGWIVALLLISLVILLIMFFKFA